MQLKLPHVNPILTVSLLFLLNLLVKGIYLGHNSIAGDEPFSIYHAQMSIPTIVRQLIGGNNPPLYEILLHMWIKLFGISPWAVRLPSLLFSCLTVAAMYRFCLVYLNPSIAFFASLIFIFSNYHIALAQEARAYTLFGLLTVLAMSAYMQVIREEQPSLRSLTQLAGCCVLLVYTHYFGLFVLLIQALHFCSTKSIRQKLLKPLVKTSAVIALCCLPFLVVFLYRSYDYVTKETWVKAPEVVVDLYNMLWRFCNAPVVTVAVIVVFVAALAKWFYYRQQAKLDSTQSLLLIWFVFPFFFMFCVSFYAPIFLDRYLMFAAVGFCVLLATVAEGLVKAGRYKYVVPVLVCVLFAVSAKPKLTNKREVAATLNKLMQLKTPETLVIFCPHYFYFNFAYYSDPEVFKTVAVDNPAEYLKQQLKARNIIGVKSIGEVDYRPYKHILYLDIAANSLFPKNEILPTLSKTHRQTAKHHFPEIFELYEFRAKYD